MSANPYCERQPIQPHVQPRVRLRGLSFPDATILGAVAVFVAIVVLQWHGPGSLPGTDAGAYITSGVNLVSKGSFTNLSGKPELWFPPLYPALIGTVSLGGTVDPTTAARLISAAFSLLALLLTGYFARQIAHTAYEPAVAMLILAAIPIFQRSAVFALSEATATALGLCGFAVWLRLPYGGHLLNYCYLGAFIGLDYLARPEGLLLLVLWAVVDSALSKGARPVLAKYALAFGITALLVFPYVLYLYSQTGKLALTGKSAVNLASGRATYFEEPREYIDQGTLEVKWWPHDVTLRNEIRRSIWNAERIVGSYWRNGVVALLALPVLFGLQSLWGEKRNRRFLWGGVCLVGYVGVLTAYDVKDRYLHATLPLLAVVAARGLVDLGMSVKRQGWQDWPKAALASALVLGLIVQFGTTIRPNQDAEVARLALLRDAGLKLRDSGLAPGVVYEKWGCVAFYADQETRPLPSDDIRTILRYIDKYESPTKPVYLALSSVESPAYDTSVKALLVSAKGFPRLQRQVTLSDERGLAVIYRVASQNAMAR